MLVAVQSTGFVQAARTGFLISLPGYAAALYWIALPVHDFGNLPWILALPCPVLLGGLLAAYAGVFCAGLFLIRRQAGQVSACFFSGALWTALELVRNHFLTGFSWLPLASALAGWPQTLGPAAWIGAFGLSGLLVALTHAVVLGRGLKKLAALPLLLLIFLPSWISTPKTPHDLAEVVLIQGNIDQSLKWDEESQSKILQTYVDLSLDAVRERKADLLVWPETAMPFYFQEPSELSRRVHQAVEEINVPLLAGAPAYSIPVRREAEEPPFVLHNRAYLLNARGETLAWYDKEHLVPFGEYVPLGKWLPFLTRLVPGEYEFRPGRNTEPLRSGPLALGTLICYEAIFPELAQKQVAQGANVLVNISNDAWFGRSSAPVQHLHLAVLRAVEQGRALIRCTNTGISAFIGPDGRMETTTKLFTTAAPRKKDVPLLTETTFYHDCFGLIHLAFFLAVPVLLAACRRKGRST
jgi:apolipoprotein N-acyltransferase